MGLLKSIMGTILAPVQMVTGLLMGPNIPSGGMGGLLTTASEEALKKKKAEEERATLLGKERKRLAKRKVTGPTVLTSPLGLTGAPTVERPTLLGY